MEKAFKKSARTPLSLASILMLVAAGILLPQTSVFSASANDPDADYDRLDGTGTSGKKVNVIEWEGNLEVHVYPKGSLAGLALKIDRPSKDKTVMVIGYRFDSSPKKQIIRRAILGIDLREGFKAFKDPTADDYDKVVISNNGLSGDLVSYRLDPTPTQLYPDGHPALAALATAKKKGKNARAPAGNGKAGARPRKDQPTDGEVTPSSDDEPSAPTSREKTGPNGDGTIQPFFMRHQVR